MKDTQMKHARPEQPKKKHRILKILFSIVLTFAMIAVIFISVLVFQGYVMYKEAIGTATIQEKVAELKENPNYVEYNDISPFMRNAIVAVEDHRFYDHGGVDLIATGKMIIVNIVNREIVGGGSSITQQLARNFYFTQEKKLVRKIAEAFVAFEIEEAYDKDEILEYYLNIIFFGNNCDGIKLASNYYFSKTPDELSPKESLFLAGLPQAPSVYSVNDEKAEQRSRQVFNAMVEYGYVDEGTTYDEIGN